MHICSDCMSEDEFDSHMEKLYESIDFVMENMDSLLAADRAKLIEAASDGLMRKIFEDTEFTIQRRVDVGKLKRVEDAD